ncbi:MAG: SBBP repeat-containing protein [Bacteroidota bacterium]|nr:SBBP repeat-containing protein [Bacteroidota bacterium]
MKNIIYIFLAISICCNSQSSCNYWSTYIGKSNSDEVKGIAVDNLKNSYIIMQTNSPSLTVHPGLISDTLIGYYDAYLAKFDSCGVFVWGTYLGTTGYDSGEKIVMCPDGNIAFTGYSQANGLPTNTLSSFQPTNAGQADCFVGKITPTGHLIWLTYFGKSNSDLAFDIATDFNGNLFIGGTSTSNNLFTTSTSFQQTFGGNTDAFIAKFGSNGGFKWCTYYGGLGTEDIHALTTDVFGNIIGAGGTNSFNLNTSAGCIQPSKDNGFDCYIIKLDSSGTRVFSTYLGGLGYDDCFGMAADNTGNLYIGGHTSSSNFTTTSGAYQSTLAAMQDLFLTKTSPLGNLMHSTFFGGSDNESASRMKFYNNQIYLFATTASTDLPMFSTQTYSALQGIQNLAIIRFSTTGMPNYSAYFGSTAFGTDYSSDFSVIGDHLFLSGKSSSANYPITSGAFQSAYGTNDDGILTKLNLTPLIPTKIYSSTGNNNPLIYPNPVSTELFIKNHVGNIEVYNSLGEIQMFQYIGTNKINVTPLQNGIYFLKTGNSTVKFIKQ